MTVKPAKFLLALVLILTGCLFANAQADASTRDGRPIPNKEDFPLNIQETLAKGRIKQAEKDYQDLLSRGEEAAKLGEELSQALEIKQNLSPADAKKLERLEKIVKKIRSDLGGQDNGEIKNENSEPGTLMKIVKNIQKDTANLLSQIKKTGRHAVSVAAIESSNTLLKLIRFLRFNKN